MHHGCSTILSNKGVTKQNKRKERSDKTKYHQSLPVCHKRDYNSFSWTYIFEGMPKKSKMKGISPLIRIREYLNLHFLWRTFSIYCHLSARLCCHFNFWFWFWALFPPTHPFAQQNTTVSSKGVNQQERLEYHDTELEGDTYCWKW